MSPGSYDHSMSVFITMMHGVSTHKLADPCELQQEKPRALGRWVLIIYINMGNVWLVLPFFHFLQLVIVIAQRDMISCGSSMSLPRLVWHNTTLNNFTGDELPCSRNIGIFDKDLDQHTIILLVI